MRGALLSRLLVLLSLLVPLVRSTLTSTGCTVIFNGIYYYISPYVAGNTSFNVQAFATAESVIGLYPVTVMPAATSLVEIPDILKDYIASDDVFQSAFLQGCTCGSIRGPAEVQGLFGNRPSHGLVNLDDVMPLAPELDTAGFLTRDPSLWGKAQAVLYGSNYTSSYSSYPNKIYAYNYPTDASESPSSAVLINFLKNLTTFLSANTSAINLTSLWSSTNPSTVPSLTSLLNITYPILISQEQTNLVRKPFYTDYAASHSGRTPFVDPAPLARWAFGDAYPPSVLTDAIMNKTTFMTWFQSHVLPPSPTTCSSAFFLYVGSTSDPDKINERNQFLGPPQVPYGFSSSRISIFSEVPDSVFPIGQAPFFSNVTNHEEYLPVTVDVMVAKGCDGLIVQLARDLVKAGILAVPETGGTIYGGNILMKKEAERAGRKMRYVS